MRQTTEQTKIGVIHIGSGGVLVSDPCYIKDNANNADDMRYVEHVDLPPGEYDVIITKQDEGSWGVRVAELQVVRSSVQDMRLMEREKFLTTLGVDSGQMMVADYDQLLERWVEHGAYDPASDHYGLSYNGACAATLGDRHDWGGVGEGNHGLIGGGTADGTHVAAVSSTGFGDGLYPCYLLLDDGREPCGVAVRFLEDEEDEE